MHQNIPVDHIDHTLKGTLDNRSGACHSPASDPRSRARTLSRSGRRYVFTFWRWPAAAPARVTGASRVDLAWNQPGPALLVGWRRCDVRAMRTGQRCSGGQVRYSISAIRRWWWKAMVAPGGLVQGSEGRVRNVWFDG